METMRETILCPVCGGRIAFVYRDEVNRCEYCGSPVLGADQDRNCENHPEQLAKGVCHVCDKLICEGCMERRVGDYGGKLLTIVNCTSPACVLQSEWARPHNEELERLIDFEWADRIDNLIFRMTGLGAVLMMVFELVFVLALLYIQYLTPFGWSDLNMPYIILRGDIVIVLSILGNLLSAMILQTALQVYAHERQLTSGIVLLFLIIVQAAFLLFRGLYFGLRSHPNPLLVPMLLAGFLFATILVFVGSLMAIRVGLKKRSQVKDAYARLGLRER